MTPREARLVERACALDASFRGTVLALESTASTNDDAKELARAGAANGSFVIADAQVLRLSARATQVKINFEIPTPQNPSNIME